MFSEIEFREGDAQNLPFADGNFDRVLANFALLHLSDPGRACAEACRVLKPGGRFGFTVWAEAAENPYAQLIDDAIQAHADLDVKLPSGPPYYLYKTKEDFRQAMERAGFDGASMIHAIHRIEWIVPTPGYPFEAELNAGVRTAGFLAAQPGDRLSAIRSAIEKKVKRYAKDNVFAIPKAAYVVAVAKR
jgi:SAM-dependent methyltransferase